MDPAQRILATNAATPVVVWSKTYCGFCTRVLRLLASLEPRFEADVIELDLDPQGHDVQAALLKMTGSMTVPQVFVGGKFIGGCTETTALHAKGGLQPAIAAAVVAHAAAKTPPSPALASSSAPDTPATAALPTSTAQSTLPSAVSPTPDIPHAPTPSTSFSSGLAVPPPAVQAAASGVHVEEAASRTADVQNSNADTTPVVGGADVGTGSGSGVDDSTSDKIGNELPDGNNVAKGDGNAEPVLSKEPDSLAKPESQPAEERSIAGSVSP